MSNKIRIDLYISELKQISRTEAQELLTLNLVTVNNKICNKKNTLINPETDCIKIEDKNVEITTNKNELIPIDKKLNIVYEDDYLLVINKESGIIIHPTSFNEQNTLANYVKAYFIKNNIKLDFIDQNRLGIAHRLDKDTSGLIIVAKSQAVLDLIQKMFAENKIQKKYLALMHGVLETTQIDVEAPLKRINNTSKYEVSSDYDAKESFSSFKMIDIFKGFCLCEVLIKTGRTHQIRAHAKYIKHNILNDPLYGESKKTTSYGQYLVANELIFEHPITKKSIILKIDLPKEFNEYIKKYGGK